MDLAPQTRRRRTEAEVASLKEALVEIVAIEQPMTVRGVFYRAVSAGLIAKTEREYKNVIGRLVLQLRREGRIDYRWITDGTRWQIKPDSFDSLEDFNKQMVGFYRRALWNDQDDYVEFFTEKDSIAGILSAVTNEWDVPLNVVRGFSSETFLWSVAQTIIAVAKPTYLFHFGDYDPSGMVSAADVAKRLRGFAPEVDLHFVRIAVTPDQIRAWSLPTRPTKKSGHSAAAKKLGFKGESVEVDAIDARQLRQLASDCIEQHIDAQRLEASRLTEEVEKESLSRALNGLITELEPPQAP